VRREADVLEPIFARCLFSATAASQAGIRCFNDDRSAEPVAERSPVGLPLGNPGEPMGRWDERRPGTVDPRTSSVPRQRVRWKRGK
jgi:hypothetical protein